MDHLYNFFFYELSVSISYTRVICFYLDVFRIPGTQIKDPETAMAE